MTATPTTSTDVATTTARAERLYYRYARAVDEGDLEGFAPWPRPTSRSAAAAATPPRGSRRSSTSTARTTP